MKKFFRFFWITIILLAVVGTFAYLWQKSRPKVTEYSVVSPTKQTISRRTIATGRIDPRDKVEIKPQVSGIIKKLYKLPGDKVQKGDIIALVQVIPEMSQLSNAQSRVKVATIDYKQQEIEFNRSKELYQKEIIPQETFEQQQVSFLKAQENLAVAQDNLEIVKNGIAKRNGGFSNTNIRATISGTILDIPVKVGNSVIQANTFNDGTTIATLADMNDIIFIGNIDETEVGRIHENMAMDLRIGAIQNQVFHANLEYISPMGKSENGAVVFEIKAAAEIPENVQLRAGYSANADIILEQAKDVMSVPESCVELTGDSVFVYLVTSIDGNKKTYKKQAVSIGLSDGLNIQITKGLSFEDKIRGNEISDQPMPGK